MEGDFEEQSEGLNEGEYNPEYDEFQVDQENNPDYTSSQDNQGDWNFGGSEPAPLGGIYGLFKNTLDRKDSLKVSNLRKEELGIWNMTVRDCKRVALISDTFHHPGVSRFFENQSRIITDSAMSRDGWFTELFVTSKRYASRDSSSNTSNSANQYPAKKKSKWRIFSSQEPKQENSE
jgi:hypothetical protein